MRTRTAYLGNVPRIRTVRWQLPRAYRPNTRAISSVADWKLGGAFFDAAGIAWEYEAHGFAISRGGRRLTNYLPDFWLPDAGRRGG